VRTQIRLPNEQLGAESGSDAVTPVLGRKLDLAAASGSSKMAADKRVPKSVASMVRR
jgi:hypothetical protein